MNRHEEFRKRTSAIFLSFFFTFLYAVSSHYIEQSRIFYRLIGTSGMVFSVIFWSTAQFFNLYAYFKWVISKKIMRIAVLVYSILVVLTLGFGVFRLLHWMTEVSNILYLTFSSFLVLLATGLFPLMIALAYRRFKELIPPFENSDKIEVVERRKRTPRTRSFKIWTLTVAIILCFISFVFMALREYKISGFVFWAACLMLGYRAKWNNYRFEMAPTHLTWLIIAFSSLMGFYGALWDWFTGFLFYLCNFIILILTNSYRNESIMRWFVMIFSLFAAFIGLLFHFLFSMRYY